MAKTRSAKKPESRSPYQKYGKSPYKYEHSTCRHSRSVFQAVAAQGNRDGWHGEVCATCNIIVRNLSERTQRQAA